MAPNFGSSTWVRRIGNLPSTAQEPLSIRCRYKLQVPSRRRARKGRARPSDLFFAFSDRAADDVGHIATLFLFFLEEGLVIVCRNILRLFDVHQRLVALDLRGGLGCEFLVRNEFLLRLARLIFG